MNFNGLVWIKQVLLLLPKELHSDFVFPGIESAFDFIAFLYGFMCDNKQTLYFQFRLVELFYSIYKTAIFLLYVIRDEWLIYKYTRMIINIVFNIRRQSSDLWIYVFIEISSKSRLYIYSTSDPNACADQAQTNGRTAHYDSQLNFNTFG